MDDMHALERQLTSVVQDAMRPPRPVDAAAIVDKLEAADVEFAVVAGTPSELALELARASNGRVIPLFSPYTHELGRRDWYLDPRVAAMAWPC